MTEQVSSTWGNETEEAFFVQMRGCRDNYRRLGDAFHAVLGAQTAIEYGCGVGDQTARLVELGWRVTAYEWSAVAREMATIPMLPFDLSSYAYFGGHADVCICTETAEHLPADFADQIVEHVSASASKFVIWSAAPPGQEWPGHVNLQPASYWLEKFAARGWDVDEERTAKLRETMIATAAQHMYCCLNFAVLVPA